MQGSGGPARGPSSASVVVNRSRSEAASRRRLRSLVVLMIALATLLTVWLALCVRFVANPRIDPHQPVEALYVLGPLESRLEPALALMDAGVAPVMLATLSVDATGRPYFTDHCGRTTPGYRIECVLPDPYTTRGEARLLAEQVRAHGWTKVALLASTAQAERARLLVGRCVAVTVLVWDHPEPRTPTDWLGEFVHQSGGWAQAQLEPGC